MANEGIENGIQVAMMMMMMMTMTTMHAKVIDEDPPWGHPKTLNKAKEHPKEAPKKIQKVSMDSHHHGLTVVATTTHGENHLLCQFCVFNLLIF